MLAMSADGSSVWGFDNVATFARVDLAASSIAIIRSPTTEQSIFLTDVARLQPCAVGAGSVDHKLYILDANYGKWRFFGDTLRPLSARPCISDDGTVCYTAHIDGTLCRWDIASGCRVLVTLPAPPALIGMTAGGAAVYGLALDGRLAVFDPNNGAVLGHQASVR